MVKSIFVNPIQLKGLENSRANHLIVFEKGLNSTIWDKLKTFNMDLSICIGAFGADGCPANPLTQKKLFQKIQNALSYQPKEIWIDHFRFDGYWEEVKEGHLPNTHQDCEFCKGKNRVSVLNEVTHKVINLVGGKSQLGYFAVPFKSEETPELITKLGQDHSIIGKLFDMSSPMLYQQMINKPISYISEYIQWLFKQTQKPVLPIIQVKSMPDDLEDTITKDIIAAEFQEAIKTPSIGVCFFWWMHVLERNKEAIIKRLFSPTIYSKFRVS